MDRETLEKCVDIANTKVREFTFEAMKCHDKSKTRTLDERANGAKAVELAIYELLSAVTK